MSTEKKGSKKPKKKVVKPSSSQYSDNRLKVEGDANTTAFVVGDNNRVDLRATQPKPLEVLAYEGNERLLVPLGRWIMRTFFHSNMNHSLKPFTLVISVLAVATGYFSLGQIYLDPRSIAGNPYVLLAWLLGFAVTISFGGGVIGISKETTCPKCHQKFMFIRDRRFQTGQGFDRGMAITNYKDNYTCENCGYQRKNVPHVVSTQIPADDADDADHE